MVVWFFSYLYFYHTMSLTRDTLMKINKNVLAGMVLDYTERPDPTLYAITGELK